MNRERMLDRVDGGSVDLLVIGAGIVGSRVAFEAAHAGLRVVLVDAGDFGGATSSASSKLVHGGLRYLATGDVRLVRRLHAERLALMRHVAPHLVRPLPLLLAVERMHARRSAKLVAALALYSGIALSRQALPRLVQATSARQLVPALDPSAVALCGVVPEAQTHDARLTLATVRGAAAAGAMPLNHVRLVSFERLCGAIRGAVLRDVHGDRELLVRCRAAVNATGPWVDCVRRLDRPGAPPLARLSKGVHAVLPLDEPWRAGVALFDESRTALAVPWQGMLLVGATDTEYESDPGSAAPSEADLAALFEPLARVLPLDPSRVVSSFAGLRVLARGPGDTARASREHLVENAPSGLISIAGGKLTSHRTMALDVLRRLPAELRPYRAQPSDEPLPGASGSTPSRHSDPEVEAHLRGLYGAEAGRILEYRDALERVHDDGPDVLAQALFARDHEYALTVDDVVRRRTTLTVRGLAGERVRKRVASMLAEVPSLAGVT